MEVHADVTLVGKVAKPWADDKGLEHLSYTGNI